MIKRKSTLSGPQPAKRKCTVQTTLGKYFGSCNSAGSGSSSTRKTATAIPSVFGVHIYTAREIEQSEGLNKEYRKFWNMKGAEICQDKRLIPKMDDASVKGAINTSWLLHKCSLLEFQAKQVEEKVKLLYCNQASIDHSLTSIKCNLERVKVAEATLEMLYDELSQMELQSEKKQKEIELETAMTELKKAQAALHRALTRKENDLAAQEKKEKENAIETHVADAPTLSSEELDDLVEIVKMDKFQPYVSSSELDDD